MNKEFPFLLKSKFKIDLQINSLEREESGPFTKLRVQAQLLIQIKY